MGDWVSLSFFVSSDGIQKILACDFRKNSTILSWPSQYTNRCHQKSIYTAINSQNKSKTVEITTEIIYQQTSVYEAVSALLSVWSTTKLYLFWLGGL